MTITELPGKPEKEGVYFVEIEDGGWDVVVVEELAATSELYCPIHGEQSEWPDGDYFGPVTIKDVIEFGKISAFKANKGRCGTICRASAGRCPVCADGGYFVGPWE